MITYDDVISWPLTTSDWAVLGTHFARETYSNSKTWRGRDPYEINCGIAGQIKAAQLLGVDPFADNTDGYDLVVDGRRVDVKTFAVRTSGTLSLQWSAIVHDDDFCKSDVDQYLFCAANLNLRRWWGVGHLARADFRQIAERYGVGDVLPSGGAPKQDCWVVPYESLYTLLQADWWRF